MLIIKISGGLGNQMFQYALYKEMLFLGKNCKMDKLSYLKDGFGRSYSLDIFPNINIEFDSKVQSAFYRSFGKLNKTYYCEKEELSIDKHIFDIDNGFISGYFQNEEYFKDVKEELLKDFVFDIKDEEVLKQASILSNNNSVSIHIRGNDYLKLNDRYGNICTYDYYKKAIELMNNKIDNPKYYVFTDDINYAKELLKKQDYVILDRPDNYKDYYDMYLMSCCRHNIIANSSFSFWGAYLNRNKDKMVICPKIWDNLYKNKQVYCNDWKAI